MKITTLLLIVFIITIVAEVSANTDYKAVTDCIKRKTNGILTP